MKKTKQQRKEEAWKEYRKKCNEIDKEMKKVCKCCGQEIVE